MNDYYKGTDYSTMHPFHMDFWYHMWIPLDYNNFAWCVCIGIYYAVKWNDKFMERKE